MKRSFSLLALERMFDFVNRISGQSECTTRYLCKRENVSVVFYLQFHQMLTSYHHQKLRSQNVLLKWRYTPASPGQRRLNRQQMKKALTFLPILPDSLKCMIFL